MGWFDDGTGRGRMGTPWGPEEICVAFCNVIRPPHTSSMYSNETQIFAGMHVLPLTSAEIRSKIKSEMVYSAS